MNDFTKSTLNYYDENAVEFTEVTYNMDMWENQQRFLNHLKAGAHILDFGCGSGRDSESFLEKGYTVTATEGSRGLCQIAEKNTGLSIRNELFQDLSDEDMYDGVWACSSLLHLPEKELVEVLKKIHTALQGAGVLYASFKYGDFSGMRNGRYFTDMNETSIKEVLEKAGGFLIAERWISNEVREGREEEKWLNVIIVKA